MRRLTPILWYVASALLFLFALGAFTMPESGDKVAWLRVFPILAMEDFLGFLLFGFAVFVASKAREKSKDLRSAPQPAPSGQGWVMTEAKLRQRLWKREIGPPPESPACAHCGAALTLSPEDLPNQNGLYEASCSKCHRLSGVPGIKVGGAVQRLGADGAGGVQRA